MASPALALTDNQLIADLADNYKKTVGFMPDYFARLVSQSHAWAIGKILSSLASRGYNLSQIQTADQTPDYERALTLFMATKRGISLEGSSDVNLKALDITEGLKDLVLTKNGAFIPPAGPYGLPGGGLPDTSDDIFVWPDETNLGEDAPGPGRGQPMDW